MNTALRSVFVRFKEMPLFLRFVLFPYCWIGSILFIDGAFVPIPEFEIKGKQVSWAEWWAGGAGPLFVVIGLLLFISAIGFYKKNRHARLTFLSAFVVALLFIWQFEEPTQGVVIDIGILFLIMVWYFFLKKTVRDYFGFNNKKEGTTSGVKG